MIDMSIMGNTERKDVSEQKEPLTPLSMHLLLALADEPMHGYALMQAVEAQSAGRVRPGTGSLYAALQRLLDEGLISIATAPDGNMGRRGNTYALTEAGAQAIVQEAGRMRDVLALVRERRALTDSDGA